AVSICCRLVAADCPLCALVPGEPEATVLENDAAVAVVPDRSRGRGNVLVVLRRHAAGPGQMSSGEVRDLWLAARRVAIAIERAHEPDGMHSWLDVGDIADAPHGHAHLTLLPRFQAVPYRFVPYGRLDPIPL